MPVVRGGILWPDTANKLFCLFGGEFDTGKVKAFNNLWYFDTIYNIWNKTQPHGTQAQVSWPSLGASAITDEGIAYYHGGYLSSNSVQGWQGDPLMLSGLLSYNMNTGAWSNQSYDQPRRAEGTLQYIPTSDRGMLVYMGGRETSSSGVVNYVSSFRALVEFEADH